VAEVATFRQKFVAFQKEIPDAAQKVAGIYSTIANHEETIKALQLQIKNLQT